MRPFSKFPSTPYLAALEEQRLRADKVLSSEEMEAFLKHVLVIEEKIDGANLGISFDKEGNIQLQNRGNYLFPPYIGQWKKLSAWLKMQEERLFNMLGDKFVLFGEWCYAKHSIKYEALPDWFMAFDIFDKVEKKFFSTVRRDELLHEHNIIRVPEISEGRYSLAMLQNMLNRTSFFSTEKIEGIYLRYDDCEWLGKRAKLVRPEFVQKIDVHWKKMPLVSNTIDLDLLTR